MQDFKKTREWNNMDAYYPEICGWTKRIIDVFDDYVLVEAYDGSIYVYDDVLCTFSHYEDMEQYENRMREIKQHKDEDDWRKWFAKKLYRQMRNACFDQTYFASVTGISESTIAKYVNGKIIPSAYRLKIMADALGCTADYLLDV